MTGLDLNYVKKGQGRTLLLVPGWSQTAKCYEKQIDGLSDRYRVIAVDMRGHGDSPKPSTGYRIALFAADLHDFILAHDLSDIALGGHSMGASIIWSYLEQFGADRIAKLIYIDQAPMVTNGFGIEGAALKETGAAHTPVSLYATAGAIISNQAAVLDGSKHAFFSPSISDADVVFNKAEALKMPAEYAARLLVDHGTQDWRDVITDLLPTLRRPTLVVGGALGTLFPPESQEWIAAKIPGAKLVMFSAEERGSHFMFWENPAKFNAVVREFPG
jgi:pimeloyl-ACP methyl ester carboxylesterase